MQTEVEPIPLADIGLVGKEVDIDNLGYPLGNCEGPAGYCTASAQEQPEALLCHPAVRGEPNVLGQLGLKVVVQADHQALQTRPMRSLNLGAGSADDLLSQRRLLNRLQRLLPWWCLLNWLYDLLLDWLCWLHDLLLDWLHNLLNLGCLLNRLLLNRLLLY